MRKSAAAIVTLVVGDRYLSLWRRYSREGWLSYAAKYGLDVITLDHPLDRSPRARERSPAWQKLLVPSQDFAKQYEQLVWIDSDVVINPASPLITDGVPPDLVGAVDEFSLPKPGQHDLAVERIARSKGLSTDHVWLTPDSYYESWGLPKASQHVVQTGVLVLSPKHHREIFEHVYYTYEDRGAPIWHYEMRPLSYELTHSDVVRWIDGRFNSLWVYIKATQYPWLLEDSYPVLRKYRGARRLGRWLDEASMRRPLATALANSYFLHFASAPYEVRALRRSVGRSLP